MPGAECAAPGHGSYYAVRSAADYAARTSGYQVGGKPVSWRLYGRAAGYKRNAEMITSGAAGCVAFIRGGSPGSGATVAMAKAAGIPVWPHTQP